MFSNIDIVIKLCFIKNIYGHCIVVSNMLISLIEMKCQSSISNTKIDCTLK